METPEEQIQKGYWIDYSQPWGSQSQYLCRSTAATVWTVALGIIVAVAFARLFKLLLWLSRKIWPNAIESAHDTPEAIVFHEFLRWLRERNDGRIRLPEQDLEIRRRSRYNKNTNGLWVFLKIFLLLLSYLGILLCGSFTGRLATDSRALSRHPSCAVYSYPSTSRDERKTYYFDAEVQSTHLADECFCPEKDAGGCNFFVPQSIPFNTYVDAPCPFADQTMCVDNGSHVINFSTGPLPARALGINAPKTTEFIRWATCSPIPVNETFVRHEVKDGLINTEYYYGPATNLNGTTWTTTSSCVENIDRRDPHYSVQLLLSPSDFQAIPALETLDNSNLSLVLISPQGIRYPQPSDDPIFKTDLVHEALPRYGLDKKYSSRSADYRAFACVDITRWRGPETSEMLSTWQLLTGSFEFAQIGASVMWQQEFGLAATKLLLATWSAAIAKDQWKVEAERMFRITLARMLVHIRNFEQGVAAQYGFNKTNQSRPAGCDNTFIFRSQGWQNVNVTGSVSILVFCCIIVLLAIPVNEKDLVLGLLWRLCSPYIRRLYSRTLRGFRIAYDKINDWMWDIRIWSREALRRLWTT